jgi:hypothetical protein
LKASLRLWSPSKTFASAVSKNSSALLDIVNWDKSNAQNL